MKPYRFRITDRFTARGRHPAAGVVAFALFAWLSCFSAPASAAMTGLADDEMGDVTGEGLALALDDFQYAMSPTSYFEMYGSAPTPNCTGSGSIASNILCFRRGDMRWFGLNMSGVLTNGYHWNDTTTCTGSSLDCPRGGVIDNFAAFDNPYILRAWSPAGMHYDGRCINDTSGLNGCTAATLTKAVYEYLAPTARNGANTGPGQPDYKFSFWGEIEVGATRNTSSDALSVGAGSILKSQTIIQGNAAGSVFRLFQFTQPGNETFAMMYHSYLRGDFRFSLNQASGSSDVVGVAPVFSGTEGMHFENVEAYLPLGQLYYQAMTVDRVGTSGAFYFDMATPLPNNATVYAKHYAFRQIGIDADGTGAGVAGVPALDTRGYDTAKCMVPGAAVAMVGADGWNSCGTANANYSITHGYSRWGDYYPARRGFSANGTANAAGATNDGIFYRSCSNAASPNSGTSCGTFYAFADRPVTIDKRGENNSRQQTQNYNCNSGNTGGCVVGAGPVSNGNPGDATRTYPVTAGNAVNLGDARFEGLTIHRLRMTTCTGGNCP